MYAGRAELLARIKSAGSVTCLRLSSYRGNGTRRYIMNAKENKIYSDGYMKGFFTALEFVSKYCSDIKISYNEIKRSMNDDTKNRKDEERELQQDAS